MQSNEVVVDVRGVTPRERHPRIFQAWDALAEGGTLVLINDHDPVPLYYQFAAEYSRRFHWEYVQQGPEAWQVRLNKGHFENHGFVPEARNCHREPKAFAPAPTPLVLDVRPIFAGGGSPCSTIDNAVANLKPGQSFVLLVPFEPAPLFGKLGAKGLRHRSDQQPDGSYRIVFSPGGPVHEGAAAQASCGCSGH